MLRRFSLVVMVSVALAGLAACGSSGGGGSGGCPAKVDTKTVAGGAITICASDLKFDVKTINAPAGSLKVTLQNRGGVYHTLKIDGTSLDLTANPGKNDEGSVTLSKGTYTFECTVPGHKQAGMEGKLVVGGG
jgi:plastocyanin